MILMLVKFIIKCDIFYMEVCYKGYDCRLVTFFWAYAGAEQDSANLISVAQYY